MESSGENLFQVKKERSYISCLVNGCSYGFKHLGMLLRYIWPSLALAIVLPIPFLFFFAAQTDAVLRKWIELGYLPNVTMKAMRRDIEKCANRSVIAVLLSFLMFVLAAVGVASLVLPIILGWKYLWSILIFVRPSHQGMLRQRFSHCLEKPRKGFRFRLSDFFFGGTCYIPGQYSQYYSLFGKPTGIQGMADRRCMGFAVIVPPVLLPVCMYTYSCNPVNSPCYPFQLLPDVGQLS